VIPPVATRYCSVVCPSVCVSYVTLLYPTKADGQNEMPFGRDTSRVLSNTALDTGTVPTGRRDLGTRSFRCIFSYNITCELVKKDEQYVFAQRVNMSPSQNRLLQYIAYKQKHTRFFCSILSSALLTRSRYLKCSSISLSIFSWSFSMNLLISRCL